MTENEAIEIISLNYGEYYMPRKMKEAFDMAISALKEVQQYREFGTVEDFKDFFTVINEDSDNAGEDGLDLEIIKNLIELKRYREIGTAEECWEAMEKQIPKNCIVDGGIGRIHYKCPSCGEVLMIMSVYPRACGSGYITPYCKKCGQAIDKNLEGMEDE